MTRKKNKLSKGFLYGMIIAVVVGVVGISLYQNAYGLTRAELDNLEYDIERTDLRIFEYEEKIRVQNLAIDEANRVVDEKKTELRKVKSEANSSWEAVSRIEGTEIILNDAKIKAIEERQELKNLLTDRSNDIKESKRMKQQLLDYEEQLDIESFEKNSKLTKLVGVNLSKSCIIMIKNNITSTCPTYDDLLKFDTSNKEISGNFIRDNGTGYLHRETPEFHDSWRWYDHDTEVRLIVDPPNGMESRIKTIEIQPNFNTYTVKNQMFIPSEYEFVSVDVVSLFGNKTITKTINVVNQTQEYGLVLYHDRYVDKCKNAVINADNWLYLLNDTINYLRTGCNETDFDNSEIIHPNKTKIDLLTSPNYQYQLWLKEVKQNCIFEYGSC